MLASAMILSEIMYCPWITNQLMKRSTGKPLRI